MTDAEAAKEILVTVRELVGAPVEKQVFRDFYYKVKDLQEQLHDVNMEMTDAIIDAQNTPWVEPTDGKDLATAMVKIDDAIRLLIDAQQTLRTGKR